MKYIDFRSDTVTLPGQEMRKAMMNANVGDDVYEEDPSINRLEKMAAEITGKEAALFVTSGTQGNLISVLTHCQRGEEIILGHENHIYSNEAGGASALGGIKYCPLQSNPDGTLNLADIEKTIKEDDLHYPITRLLCLENTEGGKVIPLDFQKKTSELVAKHNLKMHLDGARLFNAAVQLGIPARQITGYYDSVSFCLSKGLGAPVGSMICSSQEFIRKARRWRKMLGGGMRQAGIIAAAGIYALENNINRLAIDHQHAALLAEELKQITEFDTSSIQHHTNMVFVQMQHDLSVFLKKELKHQGILIHSGEIVRLVTHIDISEKDIHQAVSLIKASVLQYR